MFFNEVLKQNHFILLKFLAWKELNLFQICLSYIRH